MIVRRKHISSIILLFVVWLNTSSYAQVGVYGDMHTWKTHFAYGSVQQIADAGDLIYAMADGAIFSVDKRDGEMQYYSKLTCASWYSSVRKRLTKLHASSFT